MRTRIISGIVAALAACLVLFAGKEPFDAACAILACVAVNELFAACRHRGYRPFYAGGYMACLCLLLGAVGTWSGNVWKPLRDAILLIDLRLLMYIALLGMFVLLIFGSKRFALPDIAVTLLGSFYVCLLFWHLVLVRALPNGHLAVWFVVLGATSTDIGAYFVGTAIGRHKLSPEISPKKTVEGAIGGIAVCVAATVAYGFLFNWLASGGGWGAGQGVAADPAAAAARAAFAELPVWKTALMGVACGIVAQVGDLAASSIKRFCGIKDFGRVLPGHGGVLDRLDSILPLAPLVYVIFT